MKTSIASPMFGIFPDLLTDVNRPLMDAAGEVNDFADPAVVERLRKLGSAERVKAAIDLTLARRKAAAKFPQADRMAADPTGVEQASSRDIAAHKSRRFFEAGVRRIADLCCGIGGDAIGLAEGDRARVLLIDANPERAWMARHNVETITGRRVPAAAADATRLDLRGTAFHIDPDRRAGGRRRLRYEDYQPGPAFLERLVRGGAPGALKLSPAVDFDKLPPGEVEIINRCGTLTQAVLWCGPLARYDRTATLISPGKPAAAVSDSRVRTVLSGSGDASDRSYATEGGGAASTGIDQISGSWRPIPITAPGRYLFAVDPAVERAGLMGELCERLGMAAIHPALGLLTADRLTPSPWLTPFELIETMPWRPKRVKSWLTAHGSGIVEVKTRGGAADAEAAQKRLRGGGDTPFTVFLLREGRRVHAWITRRVDGTDAGFL